MRVCVPDCAGLCALILVCTHTRSRAVAAVSVVAVGCTSAAAVAVAAGGHVGGCCCGSCNISPS